MGKGRRHSDDPANNLVPSIMTSKKRNIGRSGLAKKVWQWAQANVINRRWTVGVPNIDVSSYHDTILATIYADAAFGRAGKSRHGTLPGPQTVCNTRSINHQRRTK